VAAKRLKKLTATEKRAIDKAAAKGVKFLWRRRYTKDDKAAIQGVAERLKNVPKASFSKESIALWSAKIDYAIANGDRPRVKELLAKPSSAEALPRVGSIAVGRPGQTQLWDDNGGCSCGGTGPSMTGL
jgi:hypothetical protein